MSNRPGSLAEGAPSGVQFRAWAKDLRVTADGTGVVSHVDAVLLRMLADRAGVTQALSGALARRGWWPTHNRGSGAGASRPRARHHRGAHPRRDPARHGRDHRRAACPGRPGRGRRRGDTITVAFKRPWTGELTDAQKMFNDAHNGVRAIGERGNSLLKTSFKALRNVSPCPWKIANRRRRSRAPARRTRPHHLVIQRHMPLRGKAHWASEG